MYQLMVMDVDGTLTDGKIYISQQGEAMKAFDSKDGYGIRHILPKYGIEAAIMTGRQSGIVEKRAEELGIHIVYQGIEDKAACLKRIMKEKGCSADEMVYVGDDINDLECMETVGFRACPADAHIKVREIADYVSSKNGGSGAVREIIDKLCGEIIS